MTADAKLLPCPFCGGSELTIECAPDERNAGQDMPDTPFAYAVFCASNDGDCGTGPTARTAEEATTAWNKRDLYVPTRDSVLEEAAVACENTPTELCQNGSFMSERCAKSVRALKSVPISHGEDSHG